MNVLQLFHDTIFLDQLDEFSQILVSCMYGNVDEFLHVEPWHLTWEVVPSFEVLKHVNQVIWIVIRSEQSEKFVKSSNFLSFLLTGLKFVQNLLPIQVIVF